MMNCNKCNDKLTVNKNWYLSSSKKKHYVCKPCLNVKSTQRYRQVNNVIKRDTSKCYECSNLLTNNNWMGSCQRKKDYICKQCHATKSKKWVKNNTKKRKQICKKYRQNNKHTIAEIAARRRMPGKSTLTRLYKKELNAIYKNRPEGYHVDHIVPLISDSVCGLHVPWNLQYLPANENQRKSNKILENVNG